MGNVLSATQVAAMAEYAETDITDPGNWPDHLVLYRDDIRALVDQDARWRALVDELVAAHARALGVLDNAAAEARLVVWQGTVSRDLWCALLRRAQTALGALDA